LAKTGATLYLTGRDVKKAKAALGNVLDRDNVHLLTLDLSSFQSVKACAADFLSMSSSLNILIENAGVMAPP
jgi:NAD(P)-dependent dehydrogenase (short-subunit alcohol dehydrogenase family)